MNNIIILGGGNAGYISALILKNTFPKKNIRVIKSKQVGIVGVGESSTEHFSDFCEYCNINKLELILKAKATFKNGIYFKDWGDKDFSGNIGPITIFKRGSRFLYCHKAVANNRPNWELNTPGAWLPKIPLAFFNNMSDSPTNQFHFDTYELNSFLHEKCVEIGIEIVEDDIVGCKLNEESGDIVSLKGSIDYEADFFIDCSGFSRLLIGQVLGVKWKSYSEYLPLNSAIAFATKEMNEYNIYTESTARKYGWSWKIPTQDRTGNGYVFCDRFINKDQAQEEMEKVYGHEIDVTKTFKFDPGRLEKAWYKNCYAIGLSQSFVEPLEASSIGSIINQMFAFVHYFPTYSSDECNETVNDIFDNIFDFVQAHYLTKRNDTPFWKEVKYDLTLTPTLQVLLDKWKRRFPLAIDIRRNWGLFNSYNFIPILYGLKWFNQENVAKEYSNYDHIEVPLWEEGFDDVINLTHKDFIKNAVRTYSLNSK